MSKPYYETEEYNEAENELDTYDDPVKLVMEYRISEKHKDNKIADLEAKLAKSEKERELDNSFWKQECDSLQKTLAEKDKEIDNLYDRLNSKQKFYEMSLEKDYKEYLSRLDKLEKQCDKDKISFTIQQLEKVKELLLEKCGETYSKTYCGIDEDIEEIIGNQINELKGGK